MPTSDLYNIAPVMTVLMNLKPKSVLDVGCGFGKYGMLMREYLDIGQGRLERPRWQVRLVAIDAFGGYRNPVWDFVYEEIHIGEAQAIVPTLGRFDAILIADVIEHLDMEVGTELVRQCLAHTGVLIVSTPREFAVQHDTHGNPYERHRSAWAARDFPRNLHVATIPALACNVFVVSADPLSSEKLYPARVRDLLYLQSRYKLRRLGRAGWPFSAAIRELNRWFA